MARKAGGSALKVIVTGNKELDRKLKALPAIVANKVLRQSMRASAKSLAQAVRDEAPEDTGDLKSGVRVRAIKTKNRGRVGFVVRIGAGDFLGDQFYAAFQEYGWDQGKRGTSGRHHVAGKHFMRHVYQRDGPGAIKQCRRLILEGIEREARALKG